MLPSRIAVIKSVERCYVLVKILQKKLFFLSALSVLLWHGIAQAEKAATPDPAPKGKEPASKTEEKADKPSIPPSNAAKTIPQETSDSDSAEKKTATEIKPDVPTLDNTGSVHNAPIVIKGFQIRNALGFPLRFYRLFRSDANGNAISIPFQIDEMNEWGDFVLDQGKGKDYAVTNHVFDAQDEIALMGNDVGPVSPPTRWQVQKPKYLHEIKMVLPSRIKNYHRSKEGAVYLGVYFTNPPPVSNKWYVKFDIPKAQIVSDRYRYAFDHNNYLVVRGVDVARRLKDNTYYYSSLLDSSTFYLNVDLKYFLSLEINARDINSELEAYKTGPIRTIVRVTFNYDLLRLKFDLGMYTEVSFFPNAVYLPAIFYNPLNGPSSLNDGSGFYYGFSLIDNPENLDIDTNMVSYSSPKGTKNKVERSYWLSAKSKNEFFYMKLTPSQQMQKIGYSPRFYLENVNAKALKSRRKSGDAKPLGEGPVNMAMHFDLTKFDEGEHLMTFKLYFENQVSDKLLDEFRYLDDWYYSARKLSKP